MNNEKAVIVGMGVLSAAGADLDTFWDTLLNGNITYRNLKNFDNDEQYRIKIGSVINDKHWYAEIEKVFCPDIGLASNYAVYASLQAVKNAGIDLESVPQGRAAVVIGTTMGEIQLEEALTTHIYQGRENFNVNEIELNKKFLSMYPTNAIAQEVQKALKLSGPCYTISSACASGNYAFSLAVDLVMSGKVDIAVAGGIDVFSRVAFTGFQRLLALTPDYCRPFDKNRKGLVVGEGGGMIVVKRMRDALADKNPILGIFLGFGLSSERYHMTSPHPDGDGAIRAMEGAVKEAGISLKDIDYVSAHGTGTPANDKMESLALLKVFDSKTPPLSSIKSIMGHAMGAASAFELIACIQMMQKNIILPTINYSEPDPLYDVDCVPNKARKAEMNCVLSNSFAFGGQMSSVIISGR